MLLIYTHQNRLLVENAKNLLLSEGIEVVLKNEHAGAAIGELSAIDCWLEVWLKDPADLPCAKQLIAQLTSEQTAANWLCKNCGEKNYPSFKLCWNCQHRHK